MARKSLKWQVNEAFMASSLPPFARLLMFVFSDLADAQTGEIPDDRTPSLKELERLTGMGKASVARHKGELVRLGWLDYTEPTAQQMSAHEMGSYRIMVGRNPEPDSLSQSETPEAAPKETRKPRPESQAETPAESHSETADEPGDDTTGVSQRDTPLSHSETASSYRPQSFSLSAAADAAAHDDPDALFAEPRASPKTETENQRTGRLTKAYTDRVKLSNYLAVRGIVLKAVQSGYTDDQIAGGLDTLRGENRSVTADALRIAIQGQPRSSNSYTPYQGHTDPNAYSGGLR